MTHKLFISYKRRTPLGRTAEQLAEYLESLGHDVFIDVETEGGAEWNKAIYNTILESDVLLVLMEPTTPESIWVRREVDFAHGCGVTVLPVRLSEFDAQEVLDAFDLARTNYRDYISRDDNSAERQAFLSSIDACAESTKENRIDRLEKLETQIKSEERVVATPDPHRYSYEIMARDQTPYTVGATACKLHVAAGNFTDLKHDIDVYVNSENDYMQMARFFEPRRVSAILRKLGTHIEFRRLKEDTVQNELSLKVDHMGGRPLPSGTVVSTIAGHPNSKLIQRHKARYIFHVVSTKARETGGIQAITSSDRISEFVINCLEEVQIVNDSEGVVMPGNSPYYESIDAQREHYDAINSILFPLFGTGHGGLKSDQVIEPMIDGLQAYFHHNHTYNTVTDIYLSVYFEEDVQMIKNHLDNMSQLRLLATSD